MEYAVTSVAKNITDASNDDNTFEKSVDAVAENISNSKVTPEISVTVKRRGETLEITSNGKTYNMTFALLQELGVPLAHLEIV